MLPLEFAPPPWYRKKWGKAVVAFGTVFFAMFLVFAGMVAWYWWKIKQGVPVVLNNAPAYFTVSSQKKSDSTSADRVQLESGQHPSLGYGSAVTIVVFVDYKCPYSKAAASILDQLASQYGSKVKIIFRDFPGDSIHQGATNLAEIGQCAYKQGRFTAFMDKVFNLQDGLSVPLPDDQLSLLATDSGLDLEKLKICLADPSTAKEVNADLAAGAGFGVNGTPTFFVNGTKIEGVIPLDKLTGYIEWLKTNNK